MKKNYISFAMFCLISSLVMTNIYAGNALKKSFWQTVGATAVAVAAGVGAYKFFDWCFSETNSQLLSRAQQEYEKALQHVEAIMVFENVYKFTPIIVRETYPRSYVFPTLTSLDKNVVFGRTYESFLYSFARMLFDRGVVCATYINDITNSKNTLFELSKKLHVRINEYKGTYVHHQEAQLVGSMHAMLNCIDQYVPHLALFVDFMQHHKNYFQVFDTEGYLQNRYDVELRIVKNGSSHSVMMYDLRESVAWRYSGKRYPFVSFVSQIGYDISSLRSYVYSLSSSYTERMYYATWLLDSLEWIKKVIASDERYTYQAYQAEQERIERLRLEALEETKRLQEAQLREQRKQNRLLAENNMLQEQQFIHALYNDHNSHQITVVVK